MIDKLNELKALKFNGSDELRKHLQDYPSFRSTLEQLSKRFLGRTVSGCSNCYFDAFMELRHYKMEKISRFELLRGALLHDPVNQDAGKILTAANCTDELALYHLKHNPNCRKYFSVLPDNLDELIQTFDDEGGASVPPVGDDEPLLEDVLPEGDEPGVDASPVGGDEPESETTDSLAAQDESTVKRVRKSKVPAE